MKLDDGLRYLCDIKMKSNLQSRNKCQNYYLKTVHLNVNTGCNGTLYKRSKFVRVIFIQYKKRFHDVVVKPFKNHHQLVFDNVFNTLIKRFIKTKPNWNQYETFWKRYVFAGYLLSTLILQRVVRRSLLGLIESYDHPINDQAVIIPTVGTWGTWVKRFTVL